MMSAFLQTLLIIHVASGFAALSTGLMSMLNQKGGKPHRLTGRIFFGGMSGVFITAVILSVLKPNPFLFMVGFFSYYLTCSGYRAVYLKNHSNQPQWIDWLINGTGMVFSIGLIVFSLSWFQSRGVWGFVPLTLGMFCLITVIKDTFSFYQPPQQPYKLSRLISHGSKMGGAFASTVTAFIVVNFTFGHATWLLWILPGIFIGIWIRKNIQVLKAKSEQRKPPRHLRTQPAKGNIVLIGLVFSAKLLWAQEVTLSGKVVNNRMEPVKYVSIGIINKPIGTVADDSGAFKIRLNRDLLSANDSLKLSSIGYHSKCVLIGNKPDEMDEQHPFIVVLREKMTELPDVVVTAEKKMEKTIGTHKKSLLNLYVNFAAANHLNQNLGSEIGRRFHIPKKNVQLKALTFFLSQNNFDSVKFRVNVYAIKGGKPYENLLKENIFINIKNSRKGWFEADLAAYDILVSENVIVALEWVSKSPKGSVLTLPLVMPTIGVHFYKYGSQNKWQRFDSMSTYMELKISE